MITPLIFVTCALPCSYNVQFEMLVTSNRTSAYDILCIICLFTRENDEISKQVPYNIFVL